jgi:hypothetical protein
VVAFEDEYRAYQEALTEALRIMRPRAEVSTVRPEAPPDALARLEPDLVICSRPDEGYGAAWIELSMEPGAPSRVRAGDRRSEIVNPPLDFILSVADAVEGAPGTGDE